jgi:hypothetical protein
MQELQEQLNSVQQRIFRANEQMDSFKMQMNWSQQELEQWYSVPLLWEWASRAVSSFGVG